MTRKDDLFDESSASDDANDAAAENVAEPEAQPYTGETPGQILRAAREAKGLSTQQLADSLRLRNAVVAMIEADDYDKMSSATYVRGYLRSFSKALEVDEKRVFEAYRAMGFGEVAASTITMQSFSKRKVRERNDSRLMLISYLIIAIVIAMAVLWWWQDSNASNQAEDLANQMFGTEQVSEAEDDARTPVTRRVTEDEARRSNGIDNTNASDADTATDDADSTANNNVNNIGNNNGNDNGNDSADSSDADDGEASTSSDANTAAQTVTEQPRDSSSSNLQGTTQRSETNSSAANSPESGQIISETPSNISANNTDVLVMTFSDACWVKVTDANAEVIAIGTKAEGYTMPLTGQAPFDIILCKPEAVSMTYNGEQVDLSGYRRSRSVTMTLN